MKNLKTKLKYTIIILLASSLFVGCADVSPHVENLHYKRSLRILGWHGFIILFSWIGSLFSDDIAIYAYNNNGGWYDFGFVIGLGGLGSSIKK